MAQEKHQATMVIVQNKIDDVVSHLDLIDKLEIITLNKNTGECVIEFESKDNGIETMEIFSAFGEDVKDVKLCYSD